MKDNTTFPASGSSIKLSSVSFIRRSVKPDQCNTIQAGAGLQQQGGGLVLSLHLGVGQHPGLLGHGGLGGGEREAGVERGQARVVDWVLVQGHSLHCLHSLRCLQFRCFVFCRIEIRWYSPGQAAPPWGCRRRRGSTGRRGGWRAGRAQSGPPGGPPRPRPRPPSAARRVGSSGGRRGRSMTQGTPAPGAWTLQICVDMCEYV